MSMTSLLLFFICMQSPTLHHLPAAVYFPRVLLSFGDNLFFLAEVIGRSAPSLHVLSSGLSPQNFFICILFTSNYADTLLRDFNFC
jgi:hypothetical protein